MDKNLSEVLNQTESTKYILPFFWQHGEPQEVLKEEIDAIERANIREFCVESRTHEDFGEEKWWQDFGFMLEEAKRRGMRVWLLDDKHFPTGYANGYVKTHPECRKNMIRAEYRDFAGPRENVTLIVPGMLPDEKLLFVTAYQREKSGNEFTGDGIDLSGNAENGLLRWSIPEGVWRVYYIVLTHKSGTYDDWIDMISPVGCEAMIKAVYEPHYEHFSEYFGNVFAGFFSDEPCFGNTGAGYFSAIGKKEMPLPWREDLPELLGEGTGFAPDEVRKLLPALFYDDKEGRFHQFRMCYMDVITRLYSECFTKRIGEWCREHGVMYIGHVIEDMGTHQRLGYGSGHFFRALQYEDMGGMDIVLQQIIPGMLDTDHSGPVCGNLLDPEFFNYYQGKLPTSQAHLNPLMKHRTMCEIFGAFGWAEGICEQKMLTDHMISNGINYFVPHAFSPKYPDPDCPPHFYARGMNPQAEAFGSLMNYMRRCCHLISDGTHIAPAALLYTPEAEWAGGKNMPGRKAGKALIRAQIDYDILWEDILPEAEVREIKGKKVLSVGPEEYRVLIIPESEYLSENMIREIQRFIDGGLLVVVTGEDGEILLPKAAGNPETALTGCVRVPVKKLSGYLSAQGVYELRVMPHKPLLRYHELIRDGKEIYFFCSEDIYGEARFTAELSPEKVYRLYDPWTNCLYTPRQEAGNVDIYLPKAGAVFVIEDDSDTAPYDYFDTPAAELSISNLSVSVCPAKGEFTGIDAGIGTDITALPGMERFAGTIRYAFTAGLSGNETKLLLGKVGEIAKVSVNGQDLGYVCREPYAADIGGKVKAGENRFVIDVINNLGYRERDRFSTYLPLPVSGLMGPVKVR